MPSIFFSEKTKRGLLTGNWQKTCEPYICAYKLVTVHFKWYGIQNIVEKLFQKVVIFFYKKIFFFKEYSRFFSKFHRELFCWIDKWYDLTLDDIRKIEEEVQQELNEVFCFCFCFFYNNLFSREKKNLYKEWLLKTVFFY